MISGLTYVPEFITEKEQESIIETVDSVPWLSDLKRRTQHYGYKYDYTKKKIDDSLYLGPLPEWANHYATRLVTRGYFNQLPNQVIVNEYLPGQGISKHIDCVSCFDNIIGSISLNSACAMDLEHQQTHKSGSILLAPLSLLVFADEARYQWLHSIPARKEDLIGNVSVPRKRRISLTFRKVTY